jgi:hypothetical protein
MVMKDIPEDRRLSGEEGRYPALGRWRIDVDQRGQRLVRGYGAGGANTDGA